MSSTKRKTSEQTIVRRLKSAEHWVGGQTTYSDQGEMHVRRLIEACVFLLSQSPRSYRQWVKRNGKKVRGKYTSPPNKLAIQRLVTLTISDIEGGSWKDYVPSWQLDEYPKDREPKVCPDCGNAHFGRYAKCGRDCPGKVALAA